MSENAGCDKCRKSSLSLLLLRPSPQGLGKGTHLPTSENVKSDPAVVAGLLPTRLPTQSRFTLRLLRAGFVHVFIEKKDGVTGWQTFRVTEDSDLLPESDALFTQKDANVTCARKEVHIKIGRKMLTIAQAHLVKSVWIAFSSNLWNAKIKKRNQAKAPAMQQFMLAGGSPNTFNPTAANLKEKVLEFGCEHWVRNSPGVQKFKFTGFKREEVDEVAAELARAAACHPGTAGKALAVVLADPVGIAAELNEIRQFRQRVIEQYLAQPALMHPLKSAAALRGIEKSFVDSSTLASYNAISPLTEHFEFSAKHKAAGAEWVPLSEADRSQLLKDTGGPRGPRYLSHGVERQLTGRIVYPDQEERELAWIKKETAAMWAKILPYHDDAARKSWEDNFNHFMEKNHYEPLEEYELDWRFAADCPKTIAYFDLHFDSSDPNNPLLHHIPGAVYAQENDHMNSPLPFTKQRALEQYAAILDKNIWELDAVALRATVCNQKELTDLFVKNFKGDPGDNTETGGMRDKMYDVLKDIPLRKYGWYVDGVMIYGMAQMTNLVTAVLVLKALGSTKFAKERMTAVVNHMMFAQARDQIFKASEGVRKAATHGAVRNTAPKMPVLISMRVSRANAIAILGQRGAAEAGVTKEKIKNRTKNGKTILLTLLTDTETLRNHSNNVVNAAKASGEGVVRIGHEVGAAAVADVKGKVTVLTQAEFLHLYAVEQENMSKAIGAVRTTLALPGTKAVGAMALTLEGRLALGAVFLQAVGLYNSIQTIMYGRQSEKSDAWFGAFDSGAGLLGGIAQLGELGTRAYKTAQISAAANASGAVAVCSFGGSLMGMAGGIINAYSMTLKRNENKDKGNVAASNMYGLSAVMFAGTGVSASTTAGAVVARFAVGRGVTTVGVVALAGSAGAEAILLTVGGIALTVSGLGLIMLGIGIVAQIGAVALTPSDVQAWVSRSYWGIDKDILGMGIIGGGKRKDRFTNWQQELAALDALTESTK